MDIVVKSAAPRADFGGLRAKVAVKFQRYNKYRETLAELDALTDRELADIGISRHQIRGIARQAAAAI